MNKFTLVVHGFLTLGLVKVKVSGFVLAKPFPGIALTSLMLLVFLFNSCFLVVDVFSDIVNKV